MAYKTPKIFGTDVNLDTSGFDKNLSSADTKAQHAFQTLNDLDIGGTVSTGTEYINLGISLSSGVVTIHSADGTALSSTNPGYVRIKSYVNQGQVNTFKLTSNYSFDESDLAGNTFGTTTSIAWANSMPLMIGFVIKSDDSVCKPVLCRGAWYSWVYVKGKPSDASADASNYAWCWDDSVTLADYDGMPVTWVGSISATKNSSDQWTIDSLSSWDGIGSFQEERRLVFPKGHGGAASGSYFLTGGTDPAFAQEGYYYWIDRTGTIKCVLIQNNCNSGGVGANFIAHGLPFTSSLAGNGFNALCGTYLWYDQSTTFYYIRIPEGGNSSSLIYPIAHGGVIMTKVNVQVSDHLRFSIKYKAA